MRTILFVFAVLATPAAAQDLVYDFSYTRDCVEAQDDWASKLACVGTSAERCMDDTEGGYTTVLVNFCIATELGDWDNALNAAYGPLMKQMRDFDQYKPDYIELGAADALRDMQRAWIPYRDAACAFEQSKWQGGSGGGPATTTCLMNLTAEQALRLQAELDAPQ